MAAFTYKALELSSGRERSGGIEGVNAADAVASLKARGLAPLALTATSASEVEQTDGRVHIKRAAAVLSRPDRVALPRVDSAGSDVRRRTILIGRANSRKGITLFTRQLATLVKARMPLLRCLEVLARQEKNAAFATIVLQFAQTIRSGGNFSEALLQQPRLFDRLYVNMVKAGEAGGVLDTVLERLALFMEKTERIKAKIKSAMTYPVIVIVLAVGIVAALMVVVVPKFEQIFSGLLRGQPLPALTRGVLSVSGFVQHHYVVTMGLSSGMYALSVLAGRTTRGRRFKDWLSIKSPVLGDLFLKAAIARFTRTFGTLLSSGVPILQALLITRDTTGNVHVGAAIQRVHDGVKEGESVADPLAASAIFPGMVTSMIEVGEETGSLPEMLTRIADTYDEEVDNAVNSLTSVIEPFMIVFLALMVGTIVIALFLPIVSIIQHLQ
ncbi:MAG: type II secretion system F family protein [Opitutus sp.]